MTRRGAGLILVLLAIAVIALGFMLRDNEDKKVLDDTADYSYALQGLSPPENQPDTYKAHSHTPSAVAWVIGGIGMFTGILLLVIPDAAPIGRRDIPLSTDER